MKVVVISYEMMAAGLEALQEARLECLTEAEMIVNIYEAMCGAAFLAEGESIH